MTVLIKSELPKWCDLADLCASRVEFERAIERLELSRQTKDRFAQLKLIEAISCRERFFEHQSGRIACDRVEPELHLRVGIFIVPGGAVVLERHPEVGFVGNFRGRNVGEHVVQSLAADILFQKCGLETRIDAEQELDIDAA